MKLYTFHQSSSAYRVRIALELKGLKPQMAFVNLTKAEQRSIDYALISPQMIVPTLIDQGHILGQSLAIMEYLEEVYPTPSILPRTPVERARVRQLSLLIAADIAPLGNLKVRKYLYKNGWSEEEIPVKWICHWIKDGFEALEKILAESSATGTYCHGDLPTMADCCLVPQVFNAKRWNLNLASYPTISRIAEACDKHPAFIAAHPSKQPDAA